MGVPEINGKCFLTDLKSQVKESPEKPESQNAGHGGGN